MKSIARAAALARLATLAAALALFGLLGVTPSIDSGPDARAAGPLPACRYDDIMTRPRGYDDWAETLVDTILRLPSTYAPPDLVGVKSLGVPGSGKVRAVLAEDLKAMSEAAAAAGNAIGVHSPYRSYATQEDVFAHWVDVHGYKRALQLSARPGHSEHQLGLAIDFRSDPPVSTLQGSWGATPAGKWMRNNAWKFGFIMSYPKGRIGTVCYDYEPWHFRYVGREVAAKVHASGLTLREYLWANYTTAVVPKVTPKPTSKATAKPSAAPATEVPSAPPTTAPATIAPATAAPTPRRTADPVRTAPPTTAAAPSGAPGPPPPDQGAADVLLSGPVWIGGLLALGTIVMGGALLLRRRG